VDPPAAESPRDQAREHEGWPLSPLVPGIGVGLLALLWLLSAAGGWATAAFCSGQAASASCRAQVAASVRPSAAAAAAGLLLAGAAVVAPAARRVRPVARTVRLRLLAGSAACFVAALLVLFITGEAAS
jgi:hypothetical protein